MTEERPTDDVIRALLADAGADGFRRAEAVFAHLADREPDRRAALLESLRDADSGLHDRVVKLLSISDEASEFFDSPVTFAVDERVPSLGRVLGSGARVGAYTIRRVVAKGGMGVVYEAEQSSPRRTVALKLLRPDFVTESLLRRFELESEILGRLDHPCIASIHESGVHVEGGVEVPFHAMEFVDGVELIEYLDDTDPAPRRRLELFLQICDGIEHAHRKAVIHRDLKPANILVGRDGRVRVVDFGIARLVDEQPLGETFEGQIVGTIAYMSPEQARGRPREIDTRTDVYSLGVILHQMLSGRHPHDLAGRSVAEAVRIISDETPPLLGRDEPAFRGDLEVIVARALEKERANRYESVAALAEDIRRHLSHRPIAARRLGAGARAWRWARREPVMATLLAVLAVSLPTIGGLARQYFASRDAVRRTELADRASRCEECLGNAYYEFGEGDPHQAVRDFREALRYDPESREAVAGLVLALIQIGERDEARRLLDDSVSLLGGTTVEAVLRVRLETQIDDASKARSLAAAIPPPRLPVEHYLTGQIALVEGHGGDHEAFARATRRLLRSCLLTPTPRELYLQQLAHAAAHARDEGTAQDAAAALVEHWPDSHASRFWAGFAYRELGLLEEALSNFEAAARLRPDVPRPFISWAVVLNDLGRHEEALAIVERIEGAWEGGGKRCANLRGMSLRRLGRHEEAVVAYRKALEYQPDDPLSLANLGSILSIVGRLAEADEIFSRAMAVAPTDPLLLFELGIHRDRQGRLDDAIAAYRESVRVAPHETRAWNNLGLALRRAGQVEAGIDALLEAVRLDDDHPFAHNNLGVAYAMVGRLEEALREFEIAIAQSPSDCHGFENIGFAYQDLGRGDEALRPLAEALRLGSDNWLAAVNLGDLLSLRGRYEEALSAFEVGLSLASPGNPALTAQARVDGCRRSMELATRLESTPPGTLPGGTPAELAALAGVACARGRHADAVEWFGRALETDERLRRTHLGAAGRAAARAARALEGRADELAEVAAEWMEEELERLEDAHDEGKIPALKLRRALLTWMNDSDFDAVRSRWDADFSARVRELLAEVEGP